MGIFERIKSAVQGSIPVEDDLDMGNSNRVKNLPSPNDPTDAVSQTEAAAAAPVQSVNGSTGNVTVETASYTLEVFTDDGTLDLPEEANWVFVDMISGGGGGGGPGFGDSSGSGGGGGGRIMFRLPADYLDKTFGVDVVVGSGGAGQPNTGDDGSPGGDTSFSVFTVLGGGAGVSGNVNGAEGGGFPHKLEVDGSRVRGSTAYGAWGEGGHPGVWGGGSGGGGRDGRTGGHPGGDSMFGAGGGGAGRGTEGGGGGFEERGGGVGSYSTGTGGAVADSATDGGFLLCGEGGVGGYVDDSDTPQPGGDGGVPGGGGGGGVTSDFGTESGGDGGRGEVRVWYW